jgi:hypothetical protein
VRDFGPSEASWLQCRSEGSSENDELSWTALVEHIPLEDACWYLIRLHSHHPRLIFVFETDLQETDETKNYVMLALLSTAHFPESLFPRCSSRLGGFRGMVILT